MLSGKSSQNAHKLSMLWKLSPSQLLVLGFAGIILLGAFLLTLPVATTDGMGLNFIDALFESTSAVCVTGLVVVDTGTVLTPFGQTVIILLIQIGGLGFMTVATLFAILLGKRIGLRGRLLMQEALNQITIQGVVKLARYILVVTFAIEGIAALILTGAWLKDLGWPKAFYFGLFHAISAFCNAGFDLFGGYRSFTDYVENPLVNIVIMLLVTLGGIGFTVIAEVYRKRSFARFSLHAKLVLSISLFLVVGGALGIFILENDNAKTLGGLSASGKLMAALFQSVTPRTAGYNTLDMPSLTTATQFLLIILMFIGASPGSTGGGIKTTTFGALLATAWGVISGKEETEIFKRRLSMVTVFKALTIAMAAALLVTIVTMALSITERADFIVVFFETVSDFGTVGLSLGITPHLTDFGKVLITITMFAGRVGPLTLAFALAQRSKKTLIRSPEEKILVG
jgi:trk system potassium uptake protein TrkH